MKRDLEAMSRTAYDLVIVGGGISGASIAWDAALRGLKVALLEKEDFAHGTTSGSSKLIHGGLRYLQNGELALVRESLRERRIWEMIAPHMVFPLPFLLPTYGQGMSGKLIMSVGLTFYDLLSYDRNRLDDPDKKLPGYKTVSREEALEIMPSLKKEGLTGGKIYYDCQMFAPERLCLEFILGAAEQGADAANYAEVTGFLERPGGNGKRIEGVRVKDRENGKEHEIRGALTVNASGPWADKLMGLAEENPPRQLIRSKGIHLITRQLSGETALAVKSEIGGHFFVIPWRGHTIIGTTDTVFSHEPDAMGVTEEDIEKFLLVVNDGLPGLGLTRGDVQHFYVGLRPLIDETPDEGTKDSYNASREAEVFDHGEKHGIDGLLSALGGKWTTSRNLAEEVVDKAAEKLGRKLKPCATESTPLYGGAIKRFRPFLDEAKQRHQRYAPDIIDNLGHFHGARMDDILEIAGTEPKLEERLDDQSPDIGAQIVNAVRNEMALHLDDALMRRSGIGTLGRPSPQLIGKAAGLMAEELGWDGARREQEIARLSRYFSTKPNGTA